MRSIAKHTRKTKDKKISPVNRPVDACSCSNIEVVLLWSRNGFGVENPAVAQPAKEPAKEMAKGKCDT